MPDDRRPWYRRLWGRVLFRWKVRRLRRWAAAKGFRFVAGTPDDLIVGELVVPGEMHPEEVNCLKAELVRRLGELSRAGGGRGFKYVGRGRWEGKF